MTRPAPTPCKLCHGLEVLRVFWQWSHRERAFTLVARGFERPCVCTGRW